MKQIAPLSAALLAAVIALTGCSSAQDKEAQASASASAQQLQQVDARSTLESFFASVKADSVSAAKAPAGTSFKDLYKNSLEYVDSGSVDASKSEALVKKITDIYKSHPTANFSVDEGAIKVDAGKSSVSISDLNVYEESGASIEVPEEGGSVTVSHVNDKDLITDVSMP